MKKIEEYLEISSLHDKRIFGIYIDTNEDLVIAINNDMTIIKIIFIKPKRIRLDNFRLGNIIFGISIAEEKDIVKLEEELLDLLDMNRNSSQNREYFTKTKGDLAKGILLFTTLQSSYGVEGYILCEEIKVNQ
jgi:hypothetical protein